LRPLGQAAPRWGRPSAGRRENRDARSRADGPVR
jgi:hypothetical protein